MLECNTCKEHKDKGEYYPYMLTQCKDCKRAKVAQYRTDNPEIVKANNVKAAYGITVEEYEKNMESSVMCEICGSTDKLVYDHDHSSYEFRGVLCNNCNAGLGFFQDDATKLLGAIQYLKKEY